ncbi:MAG: hypothetical protein AAFQ98_03875, partial [Bacteroidota bacterium]
ANYATEEVWNFMQDAYGWFKHIDLGHYDQSAMKWHADASQKFHLDKKKHFDVKIARWKPHVDAGKRVGVNEKISLTPHMDLPPVSFKPTPKKPHIDENGINIRKHKYGGQSISSPHADFKAGISKKIAGKRFHIDVGHADARVKVTAPKLPASHIDVGHVDVGTSLDKPNKNEIKKR